MIVPASGHQVRSIPWVQMGTFNKEIGFLCGLKSAWRSSFCDVITACKYVSIHSAPDVLISSSHLESCSRSPVVCIWCQSPDCSLFKRILLDLSVPGKKITIMTIYTTNESSLVQHILKMRGQVHNCPFGSIWFAISKPLCIIYMSNIYSYFYAN